MEYDTDKIDQTVLALLSLTLHDINEFGLVSGYLDGYLEQEMGKERFVFSWEGQDEMDPMTGSGWMRLKGADEVEGLIKLHLGDRSRFKARRAS